MSSIPVTDAAEDIGRVTATPLDNPVYSALAGPHAHLAQQRGNALRYQPEVSPFMALPDSADGADWADIAELAGPGANVLLAGPGIEPPSGWETVERIALLQLVDDGIAAVPDEEAGLLAEADIPEMLTLAARTKPGPFLPRTAEMGAYHGIRRDGHLVAMAGERMRLPGWTEISAVCTDPDWRGHGFASRLVSTVAAGIKGRGETPFLHVLESNADAIRLYESLGFRVRRAMGIVLARPPADVPTVVRQGS